MLPPPPTTAVPHPREDAGFPMHPPFQPYIPSLHQAGCLRHFGVLQQPLPSLSLAECSSLAARLDALSAPLWKWERLKRKLISETSRSSRFLHSWQRKKIIIIIISK